LVGPLTESLLRNRISLPGGGGLDTAPADRTSVIVRSEYQCMWSNSGWLSACCVEPNSGAEEGNLALQAVWIIMIVQKVKLGWKLTWVLNRFIAVLR